nr:MAG TPA: hypothetical protein [Caudoviricetes sp.]
MERLFKNIINIIFALLALVVTVIVSLGINLSWEALKTPSFWLEVFIKWALTMVIFNLVFEYDIHSRTHDVKGRFYKSFANLQVKIAYIHKNKLYSDLDNALSKKNTQLECDLWTERVHKVCCKLNYADIADTDDTVEEIAARERITRKRKIRQLKKLCEQIRAGERYKKFGIIPFKPIKEEYFLKDNELSKISTDRFNYSAGGEATKRNFSKSFTFLLMSVVGAAVSYSFYMPNFLSALIVNLSTIAGAIVAGFTSSARDIKMRTQIYENRNAFLERYLNITEEWKND